MGAGTKRLSYRDSVSEWKGVNLENKTRKRGRKGGREAQGKDEKCKFIVARDMKGLQMGWYDGNWFVGVLEV